MSIVFHIHEFPSCGTTHNTACSTVAGSTWQHNCLQIESGRNRGEFGCIHVSPNGMSREETEFIEDLVSQNIFSPVLPERRYGQHS